MTTFHHSPSGALGQMRSALPTKTYFSFLLLVLGLGQMGCIGDDLIMDEVEPIIRIMNAIDTLALGSDYTFTYAYFNNTGQEESISGASWSSDNPTAISVDDFGVATAQDVGTATITVELVNPDGIQVRDEHTVVVGENTVTNNQGRSGTLRTTSSYTLEGAFTLNVDDEDLILEFSEDYEASSNLPGLFIYLTNNPNTINNAFEIGAVEVFSGAHSYTIEGVDLNDYSHVLYFCKPFVVKVGDGAFDD